MRYRKYQVAPSLPDSIGTSRSLRAYNGLGPLLVPVVATRGALGRGAYWGRWLLLCLAFLPLAAWDLTHGAPEGLGAAADWPLWRTLVFALGLRFYASLTSQRLRDRGATLWVLWIQLAATILAVSLGRMQAAAGNEAMASLQGVTLGGNAVSVLLSFWIFVQVLRRSIPAGIGEPKRERAAPRAPLAVTADLVGVLVLGFLLHRLPVGIFAPGPGPSTVTLYVLDAGRVEEGVPSADDLARRLLGVAGVLHVASHAGGGEATHELLLDDAAEPIAVLAEVERLAVDHAAVLRWQLPLLLDLASSDGARDALAIPHLPERSLQLVVAGWSARDAGPSAVREIEAALRAAPGIAWAIVEGAPRGTISLRVSVEQAIAMRVDLETVRAALQHALDDGALRSVEDVGDLVLREYQDGTRVRLMDVAEVEELQTVGPGPILRGAHDCVLHLVRAEDATWDEVLEAAAAVLEVPTSRLLRVDLQSGSRCHILSLHCGLGSSRSEPTKLVDRVLQVASEVEGLDSGPFLRLRTHDGAGRHGMAIEVVFLHGDSERAASAFDRTEVLFEAAVTSLVPGASVEVVGGDAQGIRGALGTQVLRLTGEVELGALYNVLGSIPGVHLTPPLDLCLGMPGLVPRLEGTGLRACDVLVAARSAHWEGAGLQDVLAGPILDPSTGRFMPLDSVMAVVEELSDCRTWIDGAPVTSIAYQVEPSSDGGRALALRVASDLAAAVVAAVGTAVRGTVEGPDGRVLATVE